MNDNNKRLKSAVDSVTVPPFLEARIRSQIQAVQLPRPWFFRLATLKSASVGLVAVLCAGTALAYHEGHLRLTKASKTSYVWSVSNRLVSLMGAALGDHINCSVFRKYPKDAPAVAVLEQKLSAEYRELIPIVQSQVPSDYRLLISHQCRWNGRRFIHLSLENDSHVLSVVITVRKDGESFGAEGLLPALVNADIPMYQSGVQRFAITAFETPGYLVYFVSDLPQSENMRIMQAMAPGMQNLLNKLGA